MRILDLAEIAFLIAFVTGLRKRWTHGGVLLPHAVSTLSSFHQYLTPWDSSHLLFFAAWPMLAACYAPAGRGCAPHDPPLTCKSCHASLGIELDRAYATVAARRLADRGYRALLELLPVSGGAGKGKPGA